MSGRRRQSEADLQHAADKDPDAAIRELTDAARLDPTDELYAMRSGRSSRFTSSGSASAAARTPTARLPGGTCARPVASACASPSTGPAIRCARGITAGGLSDYNEQNPIAHFLLGNINRDLFNLYQTCDYLTAAASSYGRMLELNEHLAESDNARNYREQITRIARQLGC